MAISLAYFISYGVSLTMFALTYLLSAFYFNRGQIHVMRSYAQFQEKQMWIVVAARTIKKRKCFAESWTHIASLLSVMFRLLSLCQTRKTC